MSCLLWLKETRRTVLVHQFTNGPYIQYILLAHLCAFEYTYDYMACCITLYYYLKSLAAPPPLFSTLLM